MMRDPEELRDRRRIATATATTATPTFDATPRITADTEPGGSFALEETERKLRELRDGEGPGPIWLAILRADRRPSSPDELRDAMRELAREHGVALEDVAHEVDDALRVEGSSLHAWCKHLMRPRLLPAWLRPKTSTPEPTR